MQYRSEIDGLRALAVIPVILFHFNISGFHGGFIGVDIFFVISGFLITQLIVTDLDKDSFTFIKFYEKRARRLLPASFLVLIFCILAGWIILAPIDYKAFGESLVSFSLFSSNIYFMEKVGYFDTPAQYKPLLHTWSLSVEEQFYLFFPVILLVIKKWFWKYLQHIILGIFLISIAISIYTTYFYPEFGFYMLPSRAWELMLGALLAIRAFPDIRDKTISSIIALLGVCLILLAMAFYNERTPFPGYTALLPCLGTAFIIWSNINSKNIVGYCLSIKPLIFIGLISYPLYLWHWPLYVFSVYSLNRELTGPEVIFLIGLTFLLSYLTWKLLEQPVRRKVIFKSMRPVFISAILGGFIFISSGAVMQISNGFPVRLPEKLRYIAEAEEGKNTRRNECFTPRDKNVPVTICTLGISKKIAPEFIVWGDSHANMLIPALDLVAKKQKLYGIIVSAASCPPILNVERLLKNGRRIWCKEFNDKVLKLIIEKKIQNILLVGYWWDYTKYWNKKEQALIPNRMLKFIANGTTKKALNLQNSLSNTISTLKDRRIWVFEDIPDYSFKVPSYLAKLAFRGMDLNNTSIGQSRVEHERRQRITRELFRNKQHMPINFVTASNILCGHTTNCKVIANNKVLYWDSHHLTKSGALYIADAFIPMFKTIKNNKVKVAENEPNK